MNRSDSTRSRPLQHPGHRRLQVVVADPAGHTTEVLEGADVPVEEHLLGLVQIGAGEARPDADSRIKNNGTSVSSAGQVDADRPEVDLGLLAQRVVLRDHHLDQRHLDWRRRTSAT